MVGCAQAAEGAVEAGVAAGGGAALPGLIFNGKKTVSWIDASTGLACSQPAGRMECTMQVDPPSPPPPLTQACSIFMIALVLLLNGRQPPQVSDSKKGQWSVADLSH